MSGPLPSPSPARRRFRELIDHAKTGYADRWVDAVARSTVRPDPELLARSFATHLLDLGYSASFLSGLARDLHRARSTTMEICDAVARLSAANTQEFEVLVMFLAAPERALAELQPTWLNKSAGIEWLRTNGFDTRGQRSGGAFCFKLTALDAFGAAELARQMMERLLARASYHKGQRDRLRLAPHIWVKGHPEPIPLNGPARGADVKALHHENYLYRIDRHRSVIDDALELAAPLNRGALGPAIAGAWAAIESLLSNPNDPPAEERSGKAVAADRLAAIIACAWPRAELIALSHRHRPATPDALTAALENCGSTIARAQVIADGIRSGTAVLQAGGFRTGRYSDLAAIDRMARVLADPSRELATASRTFQVALRRLYRARNIVLHGGSTRATALEAAVRVAAPLIGAGLDRLTHAVLTEGVDPLQLAARAELSLTLVDGETGLSVVGLLEPPGRTRPAILL